MFSPGIFWSELILKLCGCEVQALWMTPCLNRNRKAGFRWRRWPAGSIPMERLSAPERTREELRAFMNGDLGTAAGRSDLVRLALRLIVEEVLEGEVADVLGRERCERGDGEKAG
jgi:hypothetical protein